MNEEIIIIRMPEKIRDQTWNAIKRKLLAGFKLVDVDTDETYLQLIFRTSERSESE